MRVFSLVFLNSMQRYEKKLNYANFAAITQAENLKCVCLQGSGGNSYKCARVYA